MLITESIFRLLALALTLGTAAAQTAYVHRLDPVKDTRAALSQLPADNRFMVPEESNTNYPFETAFRIGYDDDCLYIAMDMSEPQIGKLTFGTSDRKGWPASDSCEIFLDIGQTRRGYVQLAFGCDGTLYDSRMKKKDWTATWTTTIEHDADSWHGFVRIPFADLGTTAPPVGTVWGFNICRNRQVTGTRESGTWAHVGIFFHSPGKFGKLVFGSPEAAAAERNRGLRKDFAALRDRLPNRIPADYDRRLAAFAEALGNPAGNLDTLSKQLSCLDHELQAILALRQFSTEVPEK